MDKRVKALVFILRKIDNEVKVLFQFMRMSGQEVYSIFNGRSHYCISFSAK